MAPGCDCSRSTPITSLLIDAAPAAQGKAPQARLGIWGLDTPDMVWESGNQPGGQVGRALVFSAADHGSGRAGFLAILGNQAQPQQLPLKGQGEWIGEELNKSAVVGDRRHHIWCADSAR